jgi:hypothetical protein
MIKDHENHPFKGARNIRVSAKALQDKANDFITNLNWISFVLNKKIARSEITLNSNQQKVADIFLEMKKALENVENKCLSFYKTQHNRLVDTE